MSLFRGCQNKESSEKLSISGLYFPHRLDPAATFFIDEIWPTWIACYWRGEPATLATFKSIGGSVESNIDRWTKQFITPPNAAKSNLAKQETQVINQITVHIISVRGTYINSRMSMMIDGPKIELKNYALLAAIADTQMGLGFFKVTAPEKTVEFWQKDFDTFINTFRLNWYAPLVNILDLRNAQKSTCTIKIRASQYPSNLFCCLCPLYHYIQWEP